MLYQTGDFAIMKRTILDYLGIVVGCIIVSIAFVFFINPYKLVPGGVFGASIVLHNLFPALQVGTFSYMISIPLLFASYFILGKGIGSKTLLASLLSPFIMNVVSSVAYPTKEALRELDPSQLAGGVLDLSNDLILACIIGPVLIGVGEGIMMRCRATSGGSDVVAMLINKFMHIKFSFALLAVDAAVVLFGLLVIGMGFGRDTVDNHSWILSGYSLVCIFIMSKTVSFVVSGSKNNKLMFIVTERNHDDMRNFILNNLDRTATVLPSHGLYHKGEKDVLMMVVRMHEVDIVTTSIKEFDPGVFVIVTDAYDTFGERWKDFPDKSALILS